MKISEYIWDLKYRFKDTDGVPKEATIPDTHRRIATALAKAEQPADQDMWAEKFFDALGNFKFLPAGRITAGAGTEREVTLFNCYVMGTLDDSMRGIFSGLQEAALTMQQGGGIGYDFSPIRPKGAEVIKVGADASGPLSFMDVWDAMCRTVMSAGSRRGAMMATMICDHPDIEAFIMAKKDPTKLRMFNLSVLCTDAFMAAVKDDADWSLRHDAPKRANQEPGADGKYHYETVKARDIWQLIMRNTYDHAEPGVIFIDRINKANNLRAIEYISATNPCGEQPLPPYGACLLGSINLVTMIIRAFQKDAVINYDLLRETTRMAIRMLDNAIDVSLFPLPQQAEEAKNKRRIGLGVTGVADAMMMCGIRYGSDTAAKWLDDVMATISKYAYHESIHLAIEKGPFPLFNADDYLADGTYASTQPDDVQALIRKYGIRNSHLLSIAPTGTISLYAGNISSGIEPVFRPEHDRNILNPDGSKSVHHVVDYAIEMWRRVGPNDGSGLLANPFPPAYVDVSTLTPEEHITMQAVAQRWVDTSISKTINLPETIPFDQFEQVYWMAYNLGCKGCTTYRPNDVTGSILIDPDKKAPTNEPIEVPDVLSGVRYKIKFGAMEHALYVHINDHEKRPFEIFFNSKDVAHQAWMAALSRMTSAVFRRGGDISFVIEELQAIHDPIGGGWWKGKHVPSIQAAIGNVIAQHMGLTFTKDELQYANEMVRPKGALCPKCQQHTIIKEEGCEKCTNCDYNKCA